MVFMDQESRHGLAESSVEDLTSCNKGAGWGLIWDSGSFSKLMWLLAEFISLQLWNSLRLASPRLTGEALC